MGIDKKTNEKPRLAKRLETISRIADVDFADVRDNIRALCVHMDDLTGVLDGKPDQLPKLETMGILFATLGLALTNIANDIRRAQLYEQLRRNGLSHRRAYRQANACPFDGLPPLDPQMWR